MVVIQRTENLPTQWTVFLFYDVILIKCESRNAVGSHAIIDVIAGYGVCRDQSFHKGIRPHIPYPVTALYL